MPLTVLIGGALIIWGLWPSRDGRVPWLSWLVFALIALGTLAHYA